jgi:signal peptidase I
MNWDKEKIKKEIISYILIFVGVFGFKSTFFEPNHIPSGSMLPSMAIGDFILVNKMQYGLKVPFSEWFGDPIYLTEFNQPKRGYIMVFEFPKNRSILYVKRLVALPGDTIEVLNDSRVFVNDKEVKGVEVTGELKKELKELYDEKGRQLNMRFETIQNGPIKHYIAHNEKAIFHRDQMKITVPEGHYFMMGDNRDYSSDSRIWGFVPQSHIRGKALFVWFNMVYPWSHEPFHFRPWRIGTTFFNGVE